MASFDTRATFVVGAIPYCPPQDPRYASPDSHDELELVTPCRAVILRALHAEPPPVWKRILTTMRCGQGSYLDVCGQKYFEIPSASCVC